MSTLIRKVRAEDAPAVTQLINRSFGRDPAFRPRGPRWFDWKYTRNPAGSRSVLMEDLGGKVIGHYGGISQDFVIEGCAQRFSQVVDSCIDPDVAQGLKQGRLFVKLARAGGVGFSAADADAAAFGLPTPEHFDLGHKLVSYWMLRNQPVFACHRPVRVPTRGPQIEIVTTDRCVPGTDEFLRDLQGTQRCMGLRSRRFLDWRFAEHPDQEYECAVAQSAADGRIRGIAYYRSGEFAGRSCSLLVDWLVPVDDDAATAALLEWASNRTAEEGRNELLCLLPPASPWASRFQEWGFRLIPTDYVMVLRPYRAAIDPEFMRSHWFYTFADLDVV